MAASRAKARKTKMEASPDDQTPTWMFQHLDQEGPWSLTDAGEDLGDILTKLGEWEQLTWHEIKLKNAKKNHTCEVKNLTKRATDRLRDLKLDPNGLLALHIGNTKVLYGFRDGAAYHILWYDPEHWYGNSDCACEPTLSHS